MQLGPALVDHRGDAGLDADHVGVEAEAATDIFVDMGVGIDQPGQHEAAAHIDRLGGGGARNLGGDLRDLAGTHREIANAIQPARRIDHPARP